MAVHIQGTRTFKFSLPPRILACSSVVGPKEGKGPLASYFDVSIPDDMYGEQTPEKAERKYLLDACNIAMGKAGAKPEDVNFYIAGDLLNQIIAASFTGVKLGIPYLGIYGACSTAAEGLIIAAVLVDGGFADKVLAATSSHYQTAERQYRYPIELNIKRKPTNQYTATAAGAALVHGGPQGIRITYATVGKVVDMGVSDANNMGAAMAPAAADTLYAHFTDTGRRPEDYDLIVTGDLSRVGKVLLQDLMEHRGVPMGNNYDDCGILLYGDDPSVAAGGSGCGCSAAVTYGYIVRLMTEGKLKRVVMCATGALLSPLSTQQGENIPCVAHCVSLEV